VATIRPNKFSCFDFKPAGPEPTLDGTLEVRKHGSFDLKDWRRVRIKDIRLVRLFDDFRIDVVYVATKEVPSGLTVTETRTGESTLDELFVVLGWHAGLEPKVQLATMTKH
jgi:hypothetical protein